VVVVVLGGGGLVGGGVVVVVVVGGGGGGIGISVMSVSAVIQSSCACIYMYTLTTQLMVISQESTIRVP
jgi:hypothetical protein